MKKIYLNDHFMTDFLLSDIKLIDPSFSLVKVSEVINKTSLPFIIQLLKFRVLPFLYLLLFLFYRFFYKYIYGATMQDDKVLYFAVENMYELSRLLFVNRRVKYHALWIWNPVSSLGKNKYDRYIYMYLFIVFLKFLGVELWTFDENDAEQYGFSYHSQIHNAERLINFSKHSFSKSKFLFVGQDKGRLDNLLKIQNILNNFHVESFFYVTKDVDKEYVESGLVSMQTKPLPYDAYLAEIVKCSGLIDIVQNGQKGMTLRVLEALFLKKKLITNNPSIKEYDFYNSNNIYLLNEGFDDESFADFLAADFVSANPDLLYRYDVLHLLHAIFK